MGTWANAVLKDEKLIFWWTGDKCHDVDDFYKDFYFSGLKMTDEIRTGRYCLVQKEIREIGKDDVEFYKNFPIHECFKGLKPYQGEPKIINRIHGIFCLNIDCKHYFEDNCTRFYQEHTLNISYDGKCKDFEKGENEGYKNCNNKERD